MTRDLIDEPPLPGSLWDALRRDEPDPRAVQRAYLRFVTSPRARALHLGLVSWLVAGFVLGWGVVFAATGDPLFGAGLRAPAHAIVPPVVAPSLVRAPASPRAVRGPRATDAPAPIEPRPSVRRAVPGPAPAVSAAAPRDPKWQHVADALRARDFVAAQTALVELEAAGTPADRDAATLALAQVLVTVGRLSDARARLERLSTSSASAVVREQAARLLADISSAADRSDGQGAATQ
jgi:hypothetical protein